MAEQEWTIVFYVEESGRSPVREFLSSLDAKTQARFLASIEQLRVRNVHAREPLVRHLEGKVWELREQSRTNIYRLLYFILYRSANCLLARFSKEDAKNTTTRAGNCHPSHE